MRFALIQKGQVSVILDSDYQPAVSPDINVVDLTTNPDVQVGWTFDFGTGLFAAPLQTLAYVQAKKIAGLSDVCNKMILGGFKSNALGDEYHYPSYEGQDESGVWHYDQTNLAGSILDSLLPGVAEDPTWFTPFWCADKNDTWAMRPHSAAQIQQVGRDAKTWKLTCMAKLAQLQGAVMTAHTVDEVNAIGWSS